MNSAVVLPVAVLAAICAIGLVFIWWWFPRHYRKGVEQDMDIMDQERADRDAVHASLGGQVQEGAEPRRKTLEEHIAIARAQIRSGAHNPANMTPY